MQICPWLCLDTGTVALLGCQCKKGALQLAQKWYVDFSDPLLILFWSSFLMCWRNALSFRWQVLLGTYLPQRCQVLSSQQRQMLVQGRYVGTEYNWHATRRHNYNREYASHSWRIFSCWIVLKLVNSNPIWIVCICASVIFDVDTRV